jgi:hypothetical protein
MVLKPEEVRDFLAGFAAADRADREARRRAGPSPARAIALALQLLELALGARGPQLRDPLRARGEEAAREVWHQLRARLAS